MISLYIVYKIHIYTIYSDCGTMIFHYYQGLQPVKHFFGIVLKSQIL